MNSAFWVLQDDKASKFIPCLKKPTDPKSVDAFILRGHTARLNGMLIVSIDGGRTEHSFVKIPFSLSTAANTPSVPNAGLVRYMVLHSMQLDNRTSVKVVLVYYFR